MSDEGRCVSLNPPQTAVQRRLCHRTHQRLTHPGPASTGARYLIHLIQCAVGKIAHCSATHTLTPGWGGWFIFSRCNERVLSWTAVVFCYILSFVPHFRLTALLNGWSCHSPCTLSPLLTQRVSSICTTTGSSTVMSKATTFSWRPREESSWSTLVLICQSGLRVWPATPCFFLFFLFNFWNALLDILDLECQQFVCESRAEDNPVWFLTLHNIFYFHGP